MQKVRVFTSPLCAYCYTLKEFLKKHQIVFEEIDVSEDEKSRDCLIEKTGQMEVPVVEIDNQIVLGFDREKITRLLNINE